MTDLDVDPEEETIELYQKLLPKLSPATTRALILPQPAPPLVANGVEIQTPQSILATNQLEQNKRAGLPRVMVLYMPHNAADPMEQLAASLVDDITIGLCRLRTLSVVAPYTSKRVVTESPIDSFEGLNAQFGVNYAVDSKIVRRDGFCFLSVKLVDVATQEIVWAEKQKFDYVLPEQQYRQLSIRIILSVVSVIEKSELDRYNKLYQDPNAYYWYLIGKREIDKFDLPKLRQSHQAFKNALTASPDFVPALSGIDWLAEQIAAANFVLRLFNVTSDIGLPVFMATISPATQHGTYLHFDLAAGYGCHLSPRVAAMRAITEAAQTRITNISGARDDFDPSEYAQRLAPDLGVYIHAEPADHWRFDEPEPADRASLETYLEPLRRRGIGSVVVVPMGGEDYGMSVCRVLVNELESPAGIRKHRFGGRALNAMLRQ